MADPGGILNDPLIQLLDRMVDDADDGIEHRLKAVVPPDESHDEAGKGRMKIERSKEYLRAMRYGRRPA